MDDRGWGWSDLQIGTTAAQVSALAQSDEDFSIGEYYVRFNYDTLDNLNFPNAGTRLIAELRRSSDDIGADENFNAVTANALTARTWGTNTGLLRVATGVTFDGDAPVQNLFQLGGLFNLSGLQTDELSGQEFVLGQLIYYRNFGARPGSFGVPVYLGASLEAGNVYQDRDDIDFDGLIIAGSLFVGLDTILGPVYLALGFTEGGNDSAYLFLCQAF